MYCPRLDHFVRFNPSGTVSRCGHMTQAPEFSSLEEMEQSLWLRNTKLSFHKGIWPSECIRCKQTEQISNTSIRLNAVEFDQKQTRHRSRQRPRRRRDLAETNQPVARIFHTQLDQTHFTEGTERTGCLCGRP